MTLAQIAMNDELRTEVVAVQIKRFSSPVRWEPWMAMAVAAGAGAVLTAALLVTSVLILRALGVR